MATKQEENVQTPQEEKATISTVVKPREDKVQVVGADEMVIKRADFEGVLARIDELEKTTRKTTTATPKISTERVVQVAFYEGNPVVELGKFSSTFDGKNETLWIDITVQEGENRVVRKVPYVDFLRDCERRNGRIIKRYVNPIITEQKDINGNVITIEKKYVDDYSTKGTGKFVPATVESIEQDFDLEFDDGLKLTMSDKYVNI